MTNVSSVAKNYSLPRISIKMQTLSAIIAIACAVVLPQIIHTIGLVSGSNSALGEILLPMHLPIILVGFIAGPYAGTLTGLLAPVISFILTTMPGQLMLPFITIEMVCYGLAAGLIRNAKVNSLVKVIIVQIVGRTVRAVAILAGFYLFAGAVAPKIILTSIAVGFVGILIQWMVIPMIIKCISKAE